MREANAQTTQEPVLEGQTFALSLLNRIRTVTRVTDRVYLAMGLVSGGLLLLLAFFITYQTIARKLGWVQAPGTDQMSGYTLALAATWVFSYGLRSGSHVRIDVLLPHMPRKLRAVMDFCAVACLFFFTLIIAQKLWITVGRLYGNHTITNDYPLTPLWIPYLVPSIGFSLLGLTSVQMMVSMLAEGFLPGLHQRMGGKVSYRLAPVAAAAGAEGDSANGNG